MNHDMYRFPASLTARLMLVLACFAALPLNGARAQVPDSELPRIDAPVTDLAGVLSEETARAVGEEIVRHHKASGVQLAVLLVNSTAGEPIEDYALRVATRWRGGSAARSEGALYVLAVSDRRQRLEVGYGLEDRIPDYAAARILDDAIPYLRRESFQGAVETVVRAVVLHTIDMSPLAEISPPEANGLPLDAAPVYVAILLLGTFVGSQHRRKRAGARTQEVALGHRSTAEQQAMLWMGLYLLVLGTAAGLLGFGWFHYLGALVGLLAGWFFAWHDTFFSLHYLFMVLVVGAVFTSVVTAFSDRFSFGIGAGFVAQLLVTLFYGRSARPSHTSFSSGGVKDEDREFYDLLRAPSESSSRSSGTSLFGHSHSSSSSPLASSSSSHGSSISSRPSSISSHSSSGYSGGGGRFGGGGASSVW